MPDRDAVPEVDAASARLVRGMDLPQATATNMLNMIGIGPFITLGTIVAYMGGPQALLGWVLGAVLSMCDGLVYAELGAAMPDAGGALVYLREAFNRRSWGRLMSFLFLWQMLFTAPLGMAAACVGFADYVQPLLVSLPAMQRWLGVGALSPLTLTAIGAAVCVAATLLLYRPIASVGRLSIGILALVLAAMGWVIVAGLTHFSAARALAFPPHAFAFSRPFFAGLAGATLFALYNFGGYNNVTFLGAEVRNPTRNIPRAIVLSIVVVGAVYLLMTVSILGVIPWREAAASQSLVSDFIQRLYGPGAAAAITLLILVATFGGICALSLGYSRILYAAGAGGQFFRVFGRLHPKGRFPTVALVAINAAAAALCGFSVERLIQAQMIIQIVFQFIPQIVALEALRRYRPTIARPFRMWLYPVPALVALAGWIYVALTPAQLHYVGAALVLLAAGVAAYLLRARQRQEWPFADATRAYASET